MNRMGFVNSRRAVLLRELGKDQVTLKWTQYAGTPTVDPVTESKLGSASTATLVVDGLVHFVAATTQERRFAEVMAGDVIVDMSPSVVLTGKEGLRFEIDGVEYVQKEIGEGLAAFWDAMQGGQKMWRTVLLKRAV